MQYKVSAITYYYKGLSCLGPKTDRRRKEGKVREEEN